VIKAISLIRTQCGGGPEPNECNSDFVTTERRSGLAFPAKSYQSSNGVSDGDSGMEPIDKSNGYEEIAELFVSERDALTGVSTVRQWSRTLVPGSSILDLGCGHGVPISQALIEDGFTLYGVDASASLMESFRKRFPSAHAECSAFEDSAFFRRTFDAVVAVGLMFLLHPDAQCLLIRKVKQALNSNGQFLFTSPREKCVWRDILTHRESVSLGAQRYREVLEADGLILVGEISDEGNNHYYSVRKP
jgi:2-polyprenyl-3-methyl-5-hydroxy-6-metoxy-1,4-benzoquinol methylase